MDRAEVISLVVRMAAATAATVIAVRYMVKYLDPGYASKEENQRKVRTSGDLKKLMFTTSGERAVREARHATRYDDRPQRTRVAHRTAAGECLDAFSRNEQVPHHTLDRDAGVETYREQADGKAVVR